MVTENKIDGKRGKSNNERANAWLEAPSSPGDNISSLARLLDEAERRGIEQCIEVLQAFPMAAQRLKFLLNKKGAEPESPA